MFVFGFFFSFLCHFQKEVVSYASVQRYLTEIWTGRVEWSFGKTVAFTLMVLICPPAWFYFSLPLDTRIGRAPIIKFVCHIGILNLISITNRLKSFLIS